MFFLVRMLPRVGLFPGLPGRGFSETLAQRSREISLCGIIPPVFYRKGWGVLRMGCASEAADEARRCRVGGCAGE